MKSFVENKFTFGKHKDQTVSRILDIDRKYLEWCINNDIKFTKDKILINELKKYFDENPIIYLNDSKTSLYNCKSCHSQLIKQKHGSYAYCLSCHDKFNAKDDKKPKKQVSKTEFLD